jgi:lactate racemase
MTAPGKNPAERPVTAHLQLRSFSTDLVLPAGVHILRAPDPEPLADVRAAVLAALAAPIGTEPLAEICAGVLARPVSDSKAHPSAVVVVSDNTRTVPYKGDGGILWPLVESLLAAGFPPESVTLLVSSGTHRVLSDDEIWAFLDGRAREAGVRVHCHNAADPESLTCVGRRKNGDEVFIDTVYVEADLRILTGLVEPHLMAGVSGGRKSICPGLLNVQSVREFHGPKTVAHPKATALVLEGNPCHEVALEIGGMVRPDLILNVTACKDGRVAGVFAGDMALAHRAAVEQMLGFTQIPLEREFDVVVTHGGLVGVNHYQAEKAVDVAGKAVRKGGYLVVVADTTEPDPLGTQSYRSLMARLTEMGPEAFIEAITADDWVFVHDQWGVQVWAHLLLRVPADHIFYYSPQTAPEDYAILPGVDPRPLLGSDSAASTVAGSGEAVARFVAAAVARACRESEAATGRPATVAYLADGPHGIPVRWGLGAIKGVA